MSTSVSTITDIRKHRAADATITVLQPDGKPLANRPVTVAQTNHKFLFGCTGGSVTALANDELTGAAKEKAQVHADKLVELFNFQTLPFYWGRYEPSPGQTQTKRTLAAAKYLRSRGCLIKGHPLCWHTVCADWLMQYSNEKILELQKARIRREVTDFRGVIDMWDVINEVVIMPVFDKYDNAMTRVCRQIGRVAMIRNVFEASREANPGAVLLLNDFDMSTAYECLIEACLEGGIKIDVLGLQSHMHQGYWGVEKTLNVLERFSRYGIPLHFTESTLVSGKIMPPEIVDLNDYQVAEWPSTPEGEERQAEEAATHYKTLVAHPAVGAITWWGLNDGGWLKAPSGLLRADESTKPAYTALHKLIKGEWWMRPTTLTTDTAGQVRVNGFLGDYRLEVGGQQKAFRLDTAGEAQVAVRLQ